MMTPNEMKNKTFTLALRGYSKAEVDAHLAKAAEDYTELARAYEAASRKNASLEASIAALQAELAEMRATEDAIRKALVNSQSAAQRIVEEAQEKATALEALAREKCGQVIAEFREQIRVERERLSTLRAQVTSFKARIFEQYQSHIQTVENITAVLQEDDWDMSPTDATRSVLALLRGDFERRTRNDEIEETKLDHEIDIVIDQIAKDEKTDGGAE